MTLPTDRRAFQSSSFNPREQLLPDRDSRVFLHDVTLREGEQAAAVAFSVEDRVIIANLLDKAGVPRIQVGFAGRDDDAVRAVKQSGVRAQVSALCAAFEDGWRERIASVADSGLDVLLVVFRASDAHLAIGNFTRETGLERVAEVLARARERIPTVVFQPSFATTADPDYLVALCAAAESAGAQEVAVADTVGVATPEGTARMVRAVRSATSLPIGVHLHDDYGLALANSLAALRAGATIIEVSVLGLGERAGNCTLEEMALVLEGLYGVKTGIKLEQLHTLANTVADRGGVRIPAWKSVVGDDVFTQKLDMHVRVSSRAPWLLEPFDPALVGHRRALKLGRGSGPFAVRAKLDALAQHVPDALIPRLVEFVNRRALERKAVVTDEELLGELQSLRTVV
jgi:isopropylmalate/homocitrate/citramalate synthase